MNPTQSREIVKEDTVRFYLLKYIQLNNLISSTVNTNNVLPSYLDIIKVHFLHTVPTKIIEDYLSFNIPLELPVKPLNELLEESYCVQQQHKL